MSSSKTNRTGSIIAFVISGIAIILAILVFINRQYMLDQLSVWSFTPSSGIESIEEKVQFTDKGQFTFYATQPIVATQQEFNDNCPRQEVGSPVLGCYTSNDRIFIYDVQNEQLGGMKEVTAAHEMLHAVWQRTSSEEREKLTGLLNAAYERNMNDDLEQRMAYYDRNQPTEIVNELHSILGTEVADLGEELETYYAQFFLNRQTVLSLHQNYDETYKNLYSRADELYAQMETLGKSIEDRNASYDQQLSQLSADIDSFNTRADNGSFSSMSQFNAERSALISRSNQLDAQRDAINNDIAQHNAMYEEYQAIASQIEILNSSMDSFKSIDEAPTFE